MCDVVYGARRLHTTTATKKNETHVCAQNMRERATRSSRRCVRTGLDLLVLTSHGKRLSSAESEEGRKKNPHARSHTTYTSSLHFENVSLLMLMSLATRDNARRCRRRR